MIQLQPADFESNKMHSF